MIETPYNTLHLACMHLLTFTNTLCSQLHLVKLDQVHSVILDHIIV